MNPSNLSPDQLKELKKKLAKFKADPSYRRQRTTPLAKLFGEIERYLDNVHIESLDQRQEVVSKLLDYLAQIHRLCINSHNDKFISIPLYDMKMVERLVNMVVVEGVYSVLPPGVGIPLEKRKMKQGGRAVIHKVKFEDGAPLLRAVVETLSSIFKDKSDLRDLIQVGTGFTDALTSALLLQASGEDYSQHVKNLEETSSTYQLLSLYTLLMASSRPISPISQRFRALVLSRLSGLLVERRSNGVQAMIDVVMGLRDNDKIDVSRIQQVVKVILSSKPKDLGNAEYYNNICGQLYDLLVFVNRPIMTTIAAAVAESIFAKNERIVVDFLFKKVWDAFDPEITEDIVLTSGTQLNNAFNVVISFSRQSTSERFNEVFFTPLIVPLWGYLNYQKKHKKDFEIVSNTLVSILFLDDPPYPLLTVLAENLCCLHAARWEFSGDKLTEIKQVVEPKSTSLSLLDDIDSVLETFGDILKSLADRDPEKLDHVFVTAMKSWLGLDAKFKPITAEDEDPFAKFTNLKVVQLIISKFKDQIAASPVGMLKLIAAIIGSRQPTKSLSLDVGDSDDEDEEETQDETVSAALDILSEILSTIKVLNEEAVKQLKKIDSLLSESELRRQVEKILREGTTERMRKSVKDKQQEQLLEKAIKSIADPIPSVRAYGMQLVQQLADPKVGKVSLDFAVKLHLDQLKDQEPFVYLNAIKGLETLLEMNISAVLPKYIALYTGKGQLDTRLRVGEVLLRFSEKYAAVISLDKFISPLIQMASKRKGGASDDRLRMSSMSIIGSLCHNAPSVPFVEDVVDLISGILTFETSQDQCIMRRSAIVVINDLVTSKNGLELVGPHGKKLETALKYIVEKDSDVLVREQAAQTLDTIDELFEQRLAKLSM